MKPLLLFAAALVVTNLSAQNNTVETEIRRLEQLEVQAVLKNDSAMLLKLWDAHLTVNAPSNTINFAGKTTLDRPALKMARAAFTREVEHVTVKDAFAFSMGSETVLPSSGQSGTATAIKRRYTNIWEKQASGWKLVARHANEICTKDQ